MDKTPILKAKIILPEIPAGALLSDRIKALRIAGARAVIITAPAGYGKTTAVLLSLEDFRESTHWYRLEKEDVALPVFFAHLIETLFRGAGEKTDSERSLTSIGNITDEYSLLSAVVCQDAWYLYSHGDTPRYLVFDDFQNVAENDAIREIIRYFISNMPPNIRIIVASRAQTGIQAEKLSLAGELVFIDGAGLLFTEEEIRALFSGTEDPEKAAQYAGEIYGYTEGWIAGAAMMRHMRKRPETMGKLDFDHDRQRIFRFLLGEVFAGADREMVRRAAVISLLSEFGAEDIKGIFRFDDPEETIAWLERNNFYIYKINTDPVSYRFHSLFRDALNRVLAEEYRPGELLRFHLAAAAYFENQGRCRQAAGHYISGGDEKSAVRAASERGQALMDNGDIEQAAGLIRTMPEHLIFGSATLLMIYGCALSGSETERGYSYLIQAIKMAVKNREYKLAVKAQGFAISILIQQNNFKSIKDVIGLVPTPKAMMASKEARKMLLHSLFLKFSTSFNVRPAKIVGRIIDRVGIDENEGLWQFSSLLSKGFLCGVVGDYKNAGAIIRELTGHPVAKTNDRWGAFGLQLCGYLAAHMGDKDSLFGFADKLASLGLKYADGFAAGYGAYYTALAKYLSRDLAGAVLAAGKAEKFFSESGNVSMTIFISVQRLSWQAEQDQNGGFAGRMEEQAAALEAAGGSKSYVAMARAITAARYIREGALDKAESLLLQGWKWAKGVQALQAKCGIAMCLSVLYYDKKDLRREEKYIRFFGETAAKNGYVFFRDMNYTLLVRACARCAVKNIAPQYMAALIGRYFGFDAAAALLAGPAEAAANPGAFIRRFPANPAPGIKSVRVKLFGPFSLSVDGNEINLEIFKTSKISGIFRYILAGGQAFSREKLAAAFWPDSGGKEAANSLRAALAELHKALAALDMAFDGESAIVAENSEGFFVCRPEAVESDAARFSLLYEKILAGSLEGDELRAALLELTNLYDGDYIEESISEDCAAARLHYKAAFADAAHRLADIYRGEERDDLASALMQKHLKLAGGGLTREEITVAHLLLSGASQRDIARKLSISITRVKQAEKLIRRSLNILGSADAVIAAVTGEYKLTKREADVLKYLRDDVSTDEIADELHISAQTVRVHISRLLKSLGINKRQDIKEWLDRYMAEKL